MPLSIALPHAQIIMVFYQIATKVDTVYEVEMPPAVKQLLNSFSITFSLGITYTATPLACLGVEGYPNTLLFYMILPIALVLVILVISLCVSSGQRKCSFASLVEMSLPWMLRCLFVLYPLVTNTAFQVFPMHEFDDAAFLKVRNQSVVQPAVGG